MAPNPFFRFLDEVGDGTGNKDITGDFSGGVTEFNVKDVVDAGASIFVAGSAVFRGKRGPVEEIKALKKAAGIP